LAFFLWSWVWTFLLALDALEGDLSSADMRHSVPSCPLTCRAESVRLGWLESKSSTQPPDRQADSQSCPRPAWPRKKAVSRWGLGGSGYPASKHTPSRDLIGPPASARSLTRRSVPGGQRLLAPAHGHDHYEERIYGIDGALTWTVDGRQIEIGPGQALCIPRGAIHRFDNPREPGCEGTLRNHTRRPRSAVFPRVRRGNRRDCRWRARPH